MSEESGWEYVFLKQLSPDGPAPYVENMTVQCEHSFRIHHLCFMSEESVSEHVFWKVA